MIWIFSNLNVFPMFLPYYHNKMKMDYRPVNLKIMLTFFKLTANSLIKQNEIRENLLLSNLQLQNNFLAIEMSHTHTHTHTNNLKT